MDGRGRCFDNIFVERLWRTIKQEDVYYQRYETVSEAKRCLSEFVVWYNYERLHQALDYQTPYQIYCGNIVLKKKIRKAKA
jgi:putative transposase